MVAPEEVSIDAAVAWSYPATDGLSNPLPSSFSKQFLRMTSQVVQYDRFMESYLKTASLALSKDF